jgi:hypothetical protein
MLWPPPLTLSSSPCSRAKFTAAATSWAEVGWTARAGALATIAFQIRIASFHPSSPGLSRGPLIRELRCSSSVEVRLTRPPCSPATSNVRVLMRLRPLRSLCRVRL